MLMCNINRTVTLYFIVRLYEIVDVIVIQGDVVPVERKRVINGIRYV